MPLIRTPSLLQHYREAGDGQPLVLLHGNVASWRWWLPLLDTPPAGMRCYAPDLRGCGESSKPLNGYHVDRLAQDLEELADGLALERFSIVGHSLGGAVAMQFALNHLDRVESLVLVAPPPVEGFGAHPEQRSGLMRLLGWERLADWLPGLALHGTMMKLALDQLLPGVDRVLIQPLVEDALKISPLAMSSYIHALHHWSIRSRVKELKLPVLILVGKLDPIIHPQSLESSAAALPQGRLVVWTDSGHAPQLDQSARFRKLLVDFMARSE